MKEEKHYSESVCVKVYCDTTGRHRFRKIKKGKEKRRKITYKNGEKALKINLFILLTLFDGEKKNVIGGGGVIEMHNIYPWTPTKTSVDFSVSFYQNL